MLGQSFYFGNFYTNDELLFLGFKLFFFSMCVFFFLSITIVNIVQLKTQKINKNIVCYFRFRLYDMQSEFNLKYFFIGS